MGIRIEHQPSPVAVGLAAWQTGQGAARERQQKYALTLFAQDRAQRAQREQQFGDNMASGMRQFVAGLPKAPEYASPEQQRRVGQLTTSANMLATGMYGTGQEQWGALQRMGQEVNDIVGGIKKPSFAQQIRDKMFFLDDQGDVHDQPAPGRRPFINGSEVGPSPQQVAEQKEKSLRDQQLEKENKDKAASQADMTNWVRTQATRALEQQQSDLSIPPSKRKTYQQLADEYRKQYITAQATANQTAPAPITVNPNLSVTPGSQSMGMAPPPSATPTGPQSLPMGTQLPSSGPAIRKLNVGGSGRVEGGMFAVDGSVDLGGGMPPAGQPETREAHNQRRRQEAIQRQAGRDQEKQAVPPAGQPETREAHNQRLRQEAIQRQAGRDQEKQAVQPAEPDRWEQATPQGPQPAVPWGSSQPAPREVGDMPGMDAETLKHMRILAEIPAVQKYLERVFGMEVQTIDQKMPDAPQAERPPVHSIEQEHVTAQTARRMGEPDPKRVEELHERVSRIPNKAVYDRTKGTAAGAAINRDLGMSPMQRTMGGISTTPHVSAYRQAEIDAVRSQVVANDERAKRQEAIDARVPDAMERSRLDVIARDLGVTRDSRNVNEATLERGRQAAQARDAAAGLSPEEQAEEALRRSRHASAGPRKYPVKPTAVGTAAPQSMVGNAFRTIGRVLGGGTIAQPQQQPAPPAKPTREDKQAAIEEQRAARGIAKGYARSARLGKAPNVVRVSSDADFKSLPLGAHFVGPDGVLRIKRVQ